MVRMLADEGMSTRAIAPIVGVGRDTVRNDILATDRNRSVEDEPPASRAVVGHDGRTRTYTPAPIEDACAKGVTTTDTLSGSRVGPLLVATVAIMATVDPGDPHDVEQHGHPDHVARFCFQDVELTVAFHIPARRPGVRTESGPSSAFRICTVKGWALSARPWQIAPIVRKGVMTVHDDLHSAEAKVYGDRTPAADRTAHGLPTSEKIVGSDGNP